MQIPNPGVFRIDIETAKSSELCGLLGVKSTRVKKLIYELIDEDILAAIGGEAAGITCVWRK